MDQVAQVITILFYSTNLYDAWKLKVKGNTARSSIAPLLSLFVNCTLWLKYGLMLGQNPLINTSWFGIIVSVLCIYNYYSLSGVNKVAVELEIQNTLFAILSLMVFFSYTYSQNTIKQLGVIAAIQSALMIAVPLMELPSIIKFKSAEGYISLPLSLMSLVCSLIWVFIGIDMEDNFVIIPNILGVLFSIAQLYLIYIYRSNTFDESDKIPLSRTSINRTRTNLSKDS